MTVGTAKVASVRAIGVDTVQAMTPALLSALKAADPAVEYIGRYVDTLTANEVSLIHGADYAILPFTYANELDPTPRISMLSALGCPVSVTVMLDVESVLLAPAALIAQINTWANAMKNGGFDPGAYVGVNSGLTALQWSELVVDLYMRSCSLVPEPPEGFCVEQLFPPDIHLGGGLVVDYEVVRQDFERRLPVLWAP